MICMVSLDRMRTKDIIKRVNDGSLTLKQLEDAYTILHRRSMQNPVDGAVTTVYPDK